MKHFLLDTHVLLWFLGDTGKVSGKILELTKEKGHMFFVNKISFWEIAIKNSLGKLPLSVTLDDLFTKSVETGLYITEIEKEYIEEVNRLEFHPNHRDPFDRLLIAQAMVDGLTIISKDRNFSFYDVAVIW